MPVLKFGTGAKASAVEMHVAVIHGHRVPPVGPFWPYRLVPMPLCPGAPVPRSGPDQGIGRRAPLPGRLLPCEDKATGTRARALRRCQLKVGRVRGAGQGDDCSQAGTRKKKPRRGSAPCKDRTRNQNQARRAPPSCALRAAIEGGIWTAPRFDRTGSIAR